MRVTYRGSLKGKDVVHRMRGYHAFLFPTLSENYGHVIVEAMQAGLVPIISDQTPWLGLEKRSAGWDLSLDNDKDYISAITKLFFMDFTQYSCLSAGSIEYIHHKINSSVLKQKYVNFFNEVN